MLSSSLSIRMSFKNGFTDIPVFDGSNWLSWSARMSQFLMLTRCGPTLLGPILSQLQSKIWSPLQSPPLSLRAHLLPVLLLLLPLLDQSWMTRKLPTGSMMMDLRLGTLRWSVKKRSSRVSLQLLTFWRRSGTTLGEVWQSLCCVSTHGDLQSV